MDKWPIGVFASIDAGLGVKLEVAKELEVPTIQLHAPAKSTRTPENAEGERHRAAGQVGAQRQHELRRELCHDARRGSCLLRGHEPREADVPPQRRRIKSAEVNSAAAE